MSESPCKSSNTQKCPGLDYFQPYIQNHCNSLCSLMEMKCVQRKTALPNTSASTQSKRFPIKTLSLQSLNPLLRELQCCFNMMKINSSNLLYIPRSTSLSYMNFNSISKSIIILNIGMFIFTNQPQALMSVMIMFLRELLPFKNIDESVFWDVNVSDAAQFLLSLGLLL